MYIVVRKNKTLESRCKGSEKYTKTKKLRNYNNYKSKERGLEKIWSIKHWVKISTNYKRKVNTYT